MNIDKKFIKKVLFENVPEHWSVCFSTVLQKMLEKHISISVWSASQNIQQPEVS